MNNYSLQVPSSVIGGYFSTEQIDLLSIIQCQSLDELIKFVAECDQINNVKGIFESMNGMDLETAKRKAFKTYQDTLVYHDQGMIESRSNRLNYLGLASEEELMSVLEKTHPRSQEILARNHHFISEERDQIKDPDMYDEMVLLNEQLSNFNCLLIESGKIHFVVNKYDSDKSNQFDFYHAQRDLDFAYRNGKQVRYHSLLVKETGRVLENKSKEEIIELIKDYVKASIDFINSYNNSHKVMFDGKEKPVIGAIDLFNEIISFEKNQQGEYFNIWEEKYGITLPELLSCFDYAFEHKPEGVSYLYNEPFLENDERRKKVIETLNQIHSLRPGLIDTMGTQMHITITQDLDSVKRSLEDLRKLEEQEMKIQITEFDMSLGRLDVSHVFGPNPDATLQQVYQLKTAKIEKLSEIIRTSGVHLSGVSYWALTDRVDSNLERVRSNALKNRQITDVHEIPTVCGGLFPTYQMRIKSNETIERTSGKENTNQPTGISK